MNRVALLSLMISGVVLAQGVAPPGNATVAATVPQTTGTLNLYVDPTGSDSNPCTATGTAACLTLQAAIDKIPNLIRHAVFVKLAAGNYAGAYISSFSFDPAVLSTGAYLQIYSDMIAFTPATGTSTGTATAGTVGSGLTFGTLTDSGQTWTVNDLRGQFVTANGLYRAIVSNTATVITIAGTWTSPAAAAYSIIKPGAVITTAAALPPAGPAVAGAANAGLIFAAMNADLSSSTAISPVSVTQIKIAPSTNNGVTILGGVHVDLSLVRVEPTASNVPAVSVLGGALTMANSVIIPSNASGSTGVAWSASFVNGNNTITNTLIRGAGSTTGVGVGAASLVALRITSAQIESVNTGIAVTGGVGTLLATSTKIDCGATAFSAGLYSAAPSASGNTSTPFGATLNVSDISNCVDGVKLTGPGKLVYVAGAQSGSGNTTGFNVLQGAKLQLSSTATMTGTTEISVDGTAYTVAAMRGATPKMVRDANYDSAVYE